MEIKRSFGVLSVTIDNDKSSMHHSNKYEKYQSFLDTAKVITCIEPGKLQDPFERLHGIGIFLLVEPGFSFDEIKFIKLSDYNRDVIELSDVVSLMAGGIVGGVGGV